MKRKLISIITALALCLSLCPAWAFAAEGEPDGSAADPWDCGAVPGTVFATLSEYGTLTISGTGAMADYDEPKSQPWYGSRKTITTVVLKSGVTTVGNNAFESNSALTAVTIPGTVASIGNSAFSGTNLQSVTIPGSVTEIGMNAFAHTHLASVTIPSGVKTVGNNAFLSCTLLEEVTFQGRETAVWGLAVGGTVQYTAFDGCDKLTTIHVPHGAKEHYSSQEGIPSGVTIIAPEDHTYDMVVSNGNGTHSKKCSGCGETKEPVPCTLALTATAEGNVISVRGSCADCGYGAELGKAVFTFENMTYGQENQVSYTWDGPEGYYGVININGNECNTSPTSETLNLSIFFDDMAAPAMEYTMTVFFYDDSFQVSNKCALPFTVAECPHTGIKFEQGGNDTHTGTCPHCKDVFTQDCDYGEYEYDDTNHWKTCKVCGYQNVNAHDRLLGTPIVNGNTTTNYKECRTCQHKWDHVDVTITLPDNLTYGGTGGVTPVYTAKPAQEFTSTMWELYTWTASDGQTLVSMEDDKLPAGLPAGDYWLHFDGILADRTGLQGVIEFTVAPATLSGKPAFGSGEGKALGEVEIALPEGWPEDGTFAWEAGDGAQVVQGTSYAYTYTSADGKSAASGSVVLWPKPASSGGGGGGGGTSQTAPPVSTTGQGSSTDTTTTTAVPPASVSGGRATAAVNTSTGNEIVKQAVENNSETVAIAPKVTGDVSRTEVSIPASTVGQIGSQTGASLTVSTPVADVTISNGGLDSLASAGGTVTVAAEQVGNSVELSVTAGGKAVENVPGGLTLTVPVESTTPGTVAVLVHEDGTREVVRKSVAGDGSVTIPLDGPARVEIVDNSGQFADVPATSWAADAVAFASAHELFSGTAPGRFSPGEAMTRGMMAVVLHNLESNPSQAVTDVFSDVDNSEWYAEGVAWAAANGIVAGYGNGQFGPGGNITREQLAVMLWRYAGSPAATDKELHFADAYRASDWALDALCWAVENGIVNGKGGGVLDPAGQATRAETAQMLKNFIERR